MTETTRSKSDSRLAECEKAIGYTFRDRDLLVSALTHTSGANTRGNSNERMEFLGDSVLGLAVVEELYRSFPDFHEGQMTQIKSAVVARQACADFSGELQLDKFLILGRAMRAEKKLPGNVMADAFESLVGAIYLDSDYATARDFVLRFLVPEIERVLKDDSMNSAKTELQMTAQRDFGQTPLYRVLDEQGPEHTRSFKIAVEIAGKQYPAAWGPSKKKAEVLAAQNAIDVIDGRSVRPQAD